MSSTGLFLGLVVQNRITGRFRRVAGTAAGLVFLRKISRAGYLEPAGLVLPGILVWLLYRERPDLVAPFEGRLRVRDEEEACD